MGEDKIPEGILQSIKQTVYEATGIYYSKEKSYLLEKKLLKLINRSHIKDIFELLKLIKSNDKATFELLINFITTNHTYFFRERNHFTYLTKDITRRGIREPMIWCAASSTGEEVYSIAMTLLEEYIQNFKIIASDIKREVLVTLKKGEYQYQSSFDKDRDIIERYFSIEKRNGEDIYKAKSHVKARIIVKKLNIMTPLEFERPFDYIFCRNVLIYFDQTSRHQALTNILRNLKVGGALFLGHSETLLNSRLPIVAVAPSVYVRRGTYG